MASFVCYATGLEEPGDNDHQPIEAKSASEAAMAHAKSWYDPKDPFEEIQIVVNDGKNDLVFVLSAARHAKLGRPAIFEIDEFSPSGAPPDPSH
jgi:hypothetical protein